MKYFSCLLFILAAMVAASAAHAQCTMPHGQPDAEMGVIVFNKDHKVMQYCNGDDWIGLWGGGGGSGSGLPAGAVIPFDSANCPSGWSPVTELAGRVIIGTGSLGTETYALGDAGGAANVTLGLAQIPSHTHSVDPPATNTNSAGNHSHTIVAVGDGEGWSHQSAGTWRHDNGAKTRSTNSAGAHTHSVNIPAFNSGSAGNGQAHENRMPYRAYIYCRKD